MQNNLKALLCLAITGWISNATAQQVKKDWLLPGVPAKASVITEKNGNTLAIGNTLFSRHFVLSPNLACYSFRNEMNGQELLRAVEPEASVTINGKVYAIGGLHGQEQRGYLEPAWLKSMTAGEGDFRFIRMDSMPLQPLLQQRPLRFLATRHQPATGKELVFYFDHPSPDVAGITVAVHYAVYDGLPLLSKWVTVINQGKQVLHINRLKNEILSLVEEESAVVGSVEKMKKQQGLYVESNYAFNNAMRYDLSDQTTHWLTDSAYRSQVNYDFQTPCRLEIYPADVTDVELPAGDTLQSVRSFELLYDSYDRQRRGLAVQRFYQAVAPWTSENPIFMHLVSKDDAQVENAINQCAATGYEALILSFGSHLDMEDTSAANLARWKKISGFAHGKGIAIGGYSLFSSRKISEEDDVINPKTGKTGGTMFGNAPCFGSVWGLAYRDKIKRFFAATGFDIWENDGPYPGDLCASQKHPGHKGLGDSQWKQMEIQRELYHWLYGRGVYINAPDWYFLDGTNKIAVGYREVNFSLPREQQMILNRQNIFDGTWDKTPSMGWGFVPLTKYQGGGPEAVLEPLSEHLDAYEQLMMQYYGAGVQACYRGPRLYDTEKTRQLVSSVVGWYKRYREVLNAPLIHLRRADGRDWDGWLHVNPGGKDKAMMLLFNPTKEAITRRIMIPLYYAGKSGSTRVREKDGNLRQIILNSKGETELSVQLPAGGYSWWVFE
ncbi:alpha-galactosidase [Flavihumibacter petaseus]|uniref:Alpha-galactosidase n=1 Tax=Flavihumibacter petaseus NBRC 106054 TaxID=1220578 RepID=A0A0E9N611_9BACT|nr:alpha-galactosidase [Flavihumibacter petaseus]GAO45243.1 hypothetical protein FPE01S_04_04870 [Flavihumibacter petaseus NBRC 106054]